MSSTAYRLASGPGWHVTDVVCTAGPDDRPFEEQHGSVCIAAVTSGTFQYRTGAGRAVLGPGSLLLGNHAHCFECGHEHGTGDRCLSFHYTPDWFESVAAAVPGARATAFSAAHLPAVPALVPLLASAEAARDSGDDDELEEVALRLAGTVLAALAPDRRRARRPNRRDERRISDALRRIEGAAAERLTLARLAGDAAMSPYHFLRVFHQVVGLTPHRFVLRTRLHRAAVRLLLPNESISAIAFDAGFNDLSTFNRRFRQVLGASPTAYRLRRQRANK